MSLSWQALRPWNKSQHSAFEELCCQLARHEDVPDSIQFVRKGAPDAGVECYWTLSDDTEWGWQAKFFTLRPDEGQWRQIDDSVRTALEKHPNLTKYFVCLPVDRADPRKQEKAWFMDRWNERVERWQDWAAETERVVEFVYWGEHEIGLRLSLEEHRGRLKFWFDKDFLSNDWFARRFEEAREDAGERYTPGLNVELPVARLFDGLGRTPSFYQRLQALVGKVKHSFTRATPPVGASRVEEYELLQHRMSELLPLLQRVTGDVEAPIVFDQIDRLAQVAGPEAREYQLALERIAEEKRKSQAGGADTLSSGVEPFSTERHYLNALQTGLYQLAAFAGSSEATLSNVPALLLRSEAGKGKTHLFCDVTQSRLERDLPSLLLLGQWFGNADPWQQILQRASLTCSKEEFLGALEAAAEARNTRALLLIDALNEGEGRYLWTKQLAGMLALLRRYPRISLALSVRSSYEEVVIPETLDERRLVREIHVGFAEHEYVATKTFFAHYGIVRPSVPLLNPEFETPLFLKLFCQGLKNNGLTEVPKGFHGITRVFDFLIASVNKKLARPDRLNFDPLDNIVHRALEKIGETMAARGREWLPYDEAKDLVNSVLPRSGGHEATLFRNLHSEGLLAVNRFYVPETKQRQEGVSFAYQRLSDHQIIRFLLDRHLHTDDPEAAFRSDLPLGRIVRDESECGLNRNLVEALCIQVPERTAGREFPDLVPHAAGFHSVIESFVRGLVWRLPSSITEATDRYINEHVWQWQRTYELLLNALLTVAADPEHPYNALRLHTYLMPFSMPDRDIRWSVPIHEEYGNHGAVDRLVDWAQSTEDTGHLGDEPVALAAIAISWLLTSSHRFLRDRATKGLVRLLTPRLHLLCPLIERFVNVNDLYVLERLFAIAYGCAMRSQNRPAVQNLAQATYRWVFEQGEPVAHVLLRDYARGVIEYAAHLGCELNVDWERVRPPYASEWPQIPSEQEVEQYITESENPHGDGLWVATPYASVMGSGDFARYVIGTNSHSSKWTTCSLKQSFPPTSKQRRQRFEASLTKHQENHFVQLEKRLQWIGDLYLLPLDKRRAQLRKQLGRRLTLRSVRDAELRRSENALVDRFSQTLGRQKAWIFKRYVLPQLGRRWAGAEHPFDFNLAQRWVLKRVHELGWSVKRFGQFDTTVNRVHNQGRSAHKEERIGKKYQWLAWHEFLARLSDNFWYRGDLWRDDGPEGYQGPWQFHRRDIDPSCLLARTRQETWRDHRSQTWWSPVYYDARQTASGDATWLADASDLPDCTKLLCVMRPEDSSHWLQLSGYFGWEEPTPPEDDNYSLPRRNVHYTVRALIVRKSDSSRLFEWATRTDRINQDRLPDTPQLYLYYTYLGEFFWSPAYQYHSTPFYHLAGWISDEVSGLADGDGVPIQVLNPVIEYSAEGNSFDCSTDEGYTMDLPAKWLVEGMGLSWNGKEGTFFDPSGLLVAFDPSVEEQGPSSLLVRKETLLRFLESQQCELIWVIRGEKTILPGSFGQRTGRLDVSGAFQIRDGKFGGNLHSTLTD